MLLSILKRGCTRLHEPPVSTKTHARLGCFAAAGGAGAAAAAAVQAHFLTFYVASA